MNPNRVWEALRDSFRQHSRPALRDLKLLFLMAHPDDETLGASVLLSASPGATVCYLTEGAPRRREFWSPMAQHGSHEDYVSLRRTEAHGALRHVGIPSDAIVWLGGTDQESIYEAEMLLESLVGVIEREHPDAIVTHAYEGGHPDHDSAALIAHLARELSTEVALLEIPLYHAEDCAWVPLSFARLPHQRPTDQVLELPLKDEEKARKHRMGAEYVSQQAVLRNFPFDLERVRPACDYDFSLPPHDGKLWYECLEWPITGDEWRSCASAVLHRMRSATC